MKKARKVRIARAKPTVRIPWYSGTREVAVEAAPDVWKVLDEETGIEIERFDSVKAAKNYCIRRDWDFGQFGRAGSRAKTASGPAHNKGAKEETT